MVSAEDKEFEFKRTVPDKEQEKVQTHQDWVKQKKE